LGSVVGFGFSRVLENGKNQSSTIVCVEVGYSKFQP
jgi:hypothetical protein